MKVFLPIVTVLLILCMHGCYDNPISSESEQSVPIEWLGALSTPPLNPALHNAYYDENSKVSLIWSGTAWDTMSIFGLDGTCVEWLGSFPTPPQTPLKNQAYLNTTENLSFIFNGTLWDTLALSGKEGVSMTWKGTLPEAPLNPARFWAYRNSIDSTVYIFDGVVWEALVVDGVNGLPVIWKGALPEAPKHPQIPQLNWAYYNTTLATSFVFNGTTWDILSKDGLVGEDGKMVMWLGSFAIAPPFPFINCAYFNTDDKCAYLFEASGWKIISSSGKDGLSIVWKGSLPDYPPNPTKNWAFYHTIERNSYIFNGVKWDILCKDGKNGKDGISILWLGELSRHPDNPKLNWTYYNVTEGITYRYDGTAWQIMCKDGQDGDDGKDGDDGENGESNVKIVERLREDGDSVVLVHNFNSEKVSTIGQFKIPGNYDIIYNYTQIPDHWRSGFEEVLDVPLYECPTDSQDRVLLKREDGTLLHGWIEKEGLYKGGKFAPIDLQGNIGAITTITNSHINALAIHELPNSTLISLYIHLDRENSLVLAKQTIEDTVITKDIIASNIVNFRSVTLSDGSIGIVYISSDNSLIYQNINRDETITAPTLIKIPEDTEFIIGALQNEELIIIEEANRVSTRTIVSKMGTTLHSNSSEIFQTWPTSNVIQNSSGSIFYSQLTYPGGKNPLANGYIVTLSPTGAFKCKTLLETRKRLENLIKLDAETFCTPLYDYNSSLFLTSFNFKMEALDSVSISKDTHESAQQITKIDNNTLAYTYIDKNKHTVNFKVLKRSDKKPHLVLKNLDKNSTVLINKSGRQLWLQVTAINDGRKHVTSK